MFHAPLTLITRLRYNIDYSPAAFASRLYAPFLLHTLHYAFSLAFAAADDATRSVIHVLRI